MVVVVHNADESHGRICKKPTFNKQKLPDKKIKETCFFHRSPYPSPRHGSRAPAGNLPGGKFPKNGVDRKWAGGECKSGDLDYWKLDM